VIEADLDGAAGFLSAGEVVVDPGVFKIGAIGDGAPAGDGVAGTESGVGSRDGWINSAKVVGDDGRLGHVEDAFEEEIDLDVVRVLSGAAAVVAGGGDVGGADEGHEHEQGNDHDHDGAGAEVAIVG
jgi:hypothetical protein